MALDGVFADLRARARPRGCAHRAGSNRRPAARVRSASRSGGRAFAEWRAPLSGLAHEQQHRLVRPASQAHRVERARRVAGVIGPHGAFRRSETPSKRGRGAGARAGSGGSAPERRRARAPPGAPRPGRRAAPPSKTTRESASDWPSPSSARRSARGGREWSSLTCSAAISSAVVAARASSAIVGTQAPPRRFPVRSTSRARRDRPFRRRAARRSARTRRPSRGTRVHHRALEQLRAGGKIACVQREPRRGDQASQQPRR